MIKTKDIDGVIPWENQICFLPQTFYIWLLLIPSRRRLPPHEEKNSKDNSIWKGESAKFNNVSGGVENKTKKCTHASCKFYFYYYISLYMRIREVVFRTTIEKERKKQERENTQIHIHERKDHHAPGEKYIDLTGYMALLSLLLILPLKLFLFSSLPPCFRLTILWFNISFFVCALVLSYMRHHLFYLPFFIFRLFSFFRGALLASCEIKFNSFSFALCFLCCMTADSKQEGKYNIKNKRNKPKRR